MNWNDERNAKVIKDNIPAGMFPIQRPTTSPDRSWAILNTSKEGKMVSPACSLSLPRKKCCCRTAQKTNPAESGTILVEHSPIRSKWALSLQICSYGLGSPRTELIKKAFRSPVLLGSCMSGQLDERHILYGARWTSVARVAKINESNKIFGVEVPRFDTLVQDANGS